MAISYDYASNKTCGYLGFQSNVDSTGARSGQTRPGDRLMAFLRVMKEKADNPLLLPTLATGIWLSCLHDENHQSAIVLRQIQAEIGLMGSYLRSNKMLTPRPTGFDAVHRKIISQHAFMTNRLSEFIAHLVPSTEKAMQEFETLGYPQQMRQPASVQPQQQAQQTTSSSAFMEELEDYIHHMNFLARAELQHHDRMLSRVTVYLQVVSRLLSVIRRES
jgi:hypothetical protein